MSSQPSRGPSRRYFVRQCCRGRRPDGDLLLPLHRRGQRPQPRRLSSARPKPRLRLDTPTTHARSGNRRGKRLGLSLSSPLRPASSARRRRRVLGALPTPRSEHLPVYYSSGGSSISSGSSSISSCTRPTRPESGAGPVLPQTRANVPPSRRAAQHTTRPSRPSTLRALRTRPEADYTGPPVCSSRTLDRSNSALRARNSARNRAWNPNPAAAAPKSPGGNAVPLACVRPPARRQINAAAPGRPAWSRSPGPVRSRPPGPAWSRSPGPAGPHSTPRICDDPAVRTGRRHRVA
jgi:hypothetical protein